MRPPRREKHTNTRGGYSEDTQIQTPDNEAARRAFSLTCQAHCKRAATAVGDARHTNKNGAR
jgi:hypothetical protein